MIKSEAHSEKLTGSLNLQHLTVYIEDKWTYLKSKVMELIEEHVRSHSRQKKQVLSSS